MKIRIRLVLLLLGLALLTGCAAANQEQAQADASFAEFTLLAQYNTGFAADNALTDGKAQIVHALDAEEQTALWEVLAPESWAPATPQEEAPWRRSPDVLLLDETLRHRLIIHNDTALVLRSGEDGTYAQEWYTLPEGTAEAAAALCETLPQNYTVQLPQGMETLHTLWLCDKDQNDIIYALQDELRERFFEAMDPTGWKVSAVFGGDLTQLMARASLDVTNGTDRFLFGTNRQMAFLPGAAVGYILHYEPTYESVALLHQLREDLLNYELSSMETLLTGCAPNGRYCTGSFSLTQTQLSTVQELRTQLFALGEPIALERGFAAQYAVYCGTRLNLAIDEEGVLLADGFEPVLCPAERADRLRELLAGFAVHTPENALPQDADSTAAMTGFPLQTDEFIQIGYDTEGPGSFDVRFDLTGELQQKFMAAVRPETWQQYEMDAETGWTLSGLNAVTADGCKLILYIHPCVATLRTPQGMLTFTVPQEEMDAIAQLYQEIEELPLP